MRIHDEKLNVGPTPCLNAHRVMVWNVAYGCWYSRCDIH